MNSICNFIKQILGFCPNHGLWFMWPKKYRRNTAYIDDKDNWSYAGKCCQEEDHAMLEEMWKDYYAGRL